MLLSKSDSIVYESNNDFKYHSIRLLQIQKLRLLLLVSHLMNQLIDLLRAVPDVIWSGLIASALTLSGVLISNRSNTTRLRIQLQHDSDQKSKERTTTLRREAYLKAVEELTKANSHLVSLPKADPTKANLAEGLEGFFIAAAKLQLVAEPKTALLVNELAATYTDLMLRLFGRAMPLYDAQSKISIHDTLLNQAQEQVSRIMGEIVKFNENSQTDPQIFGALQRSYEGFQSQASKHAADRDEAWKLFNSLHVEFCKQLLIELRSIGEQQIPVLVEIRRDLGLSMDLDVYRQQIEAQWLRQSSQLDDLLNKLQSS